MHKFLRGAIVASTLLAGSQAAFADVTVTGSYIKFGVNNGGSLIDFNSGTGIQFDPTGSGNFNAAYDILLPGSPWAFNSIGVNGGYATAGGGWSYNPFGSTTGSFVAGTNTFTITSGGTYSGLAISQVISFDLSSNVIHSNVVLTNTSGHALNDVTYAVGLDADQDYRYGGQYGTTNTILGQGAGAAVRSAGTDVAITLRNTSGWDAVASVNYFEMNPYVLSGGVVNNGNGDNTIGLGYDFGTLGAGQQRSIGFDYVLTQVTPVPEPTTWVMMLAGLGLLGAAARRRA